MNAAIRCAGPEEAERLTEIACLSKAHWGYSPAQIESWRAQFLTVTAEYVKAHKVWVAADPCGAAVGFAALERRNAGSVLEHLWVLPAYIGRGIGRRLFQQVACSADEFTFTSDPHADDFYRRMGAEKIGEVTSDYQGRNLSEFRFRAPA